MTYPQAAVAEAIDRYCAATQINIAESSSEPVITRYRHIWTPDLRLLEPDGNELYRWNGYLPPFEFAARLIAAVGQARLRLREFDAAAGAYNDVLLRFPTSYAAAEAQYFLAVAEYRKSHESSDLLRGWHSLEKTYPYSEWTVKQNF